jgi:hypothetical protein
MESKEVFEENSKGVIKRKGEVSAVKEEVSEDPTKVEMHHHIHKKDMFTEADKMIEMITGSYHKEKKHEKIEKHEVLKKYDDLRDADNKRI